MLCSLVKILSVCPQGKKKNGLKKNYDFFYLFGLDSDSSRYYTLHWSAFVSIQIVLCVYTFLILCSIDAK